MKKLLSLIIIAAILLTTVAASTTETAEREATIFDVIEILKHLVDIEPNEAVALMGKEDLTIFDALDILKGIIGLTDPVRVYKKKPIETTIPPTTTEEPLTPLEPLSKELEMRIKTDWVKWINELEEYKRNNIEIEISDIEMFYFGTYNGSAVLYIDTFPKRDHPEEVWTETVAGYKFHYRGAWCLVVWNNGKFYRLSNNHVLWGGGDGAYEKGLLTKQDIKTIWHRFYNDDYDEEFYRDW
jgi:hypothetical protein